ncbi:hypothetical protein K474DRAFT_478698 [Panus rudis PR-1116 ss-1]|nr:hypothetical protein K474DRAFT_478698 [Panus rudis PR-1116 ss-1]
MPIMPLACDRPRFLWRDCPSPPPQRHRLFQIPPGIEQYILRYSTLTCHASHTSGCNYQFSLRQKKYTSVRPITTTEVCNISNIYRALQSCIATQEKGKKDETDASICRQRLYEIDGKKEKEKKSKEKRRGERQVR